MKLIGFIAVALAGIFSFAGFFPDAAAQEESTPKDKDVHTTTASTTDPWSVVGQWHYAGHDWRGMIDIRADGTFSRADGGESGKWTLGGAQDHFTLTLAWKNLPQDTAEMVSLTEFRGDTHKGEIVIRKLPGVAAAEPEIPRFDKGKLTKKQLAFCAAFKAKAAAVSHENGATRGQEYIQLESEGVFPHFSGAGKASSRVDILSLEPPSFIMTPAELIDLLGQPDSTGKDSIFFDLGGAGGRATAVGIRIRDGHVCERWMVTTKS
jgi:hypothetical protein